MPGSSVAAALLAMIGCVLVEYGPTQQFFTRPEKRETEDYVSGRFG